MCYCAQRAHGQPEFVVTRCKYTQSYIKKNIFIDGINLNKSVALLSVCRMTSPLPAIIIHELEGEDGAAAQAVKWHKMW